MFVVLIGIFVVGVGLDELFDRYNTGSSTPLLEIQSFGRGLAAALDAKDSANEITAAWPPNSPYALSLDSISDLSLPPVLVQQLTTEGVLTLGSEHGVLLYFYLAQHGMVLSVQTMLMEEGGNSKLSWVLTIAFYAATLGLVLLWLRPLLHRHRILRQSAKAFGGGDLEARIDTRGVSYIQDIEKSFNTMADQIQQLVEDNKMLTSAVSHDLRTPLARLRFGIDTLSNTSVESSKALYLKRINNDLKEMESLVESLLRYAQLDNVLDGVVKQHIDVNNLLDQCIAQHYDQNISIQLDYQSTINGHNIIVFGGIEHIAMLINNLLSNALTHANSQLLVELCKQDNRVVISFCDDGPGIPLELRNHVLKPFERGEVSEDGRTGFGMGLAVALRIAQHHAGDIAIGKCEKLGGALVTATLLCDVDLQ